jgi:hypothetical protein
MRRTGRFSLGLFSAVLLLAAGVALAAGKPDGKVTVKLTPVPNVKSSANGTATFEMSKDGNAIHYKLNVGKIENVTMAHVHEVGDNGTPAAVLTWVYPAKGEAPSLREGKTNGTLAEGDITADKLSGPLKGKSVKELYEELKSGKAGVAVHTKQNPGGELWAFHKGMTHKKM